MAKKGSGPRLSTPIRGIRNVASMRGADPTDALIAAGWTKAQLKQLSKCAVGKVALLRDIAFGGAGILPMACVVDCSGQCPVPHGLTIESSVQDRVRIVTAESAGSYLSGTQVGGAIDGVRLRKELVQCDLMGPTMLEFYKAHPDLAPQGWKRRGVCVWFHRVLFRNEKGQLCVCGFEWDPKGGDGGGFEHRVKPLQEDPADEEVGLGVVGGDWGDEDLAAVWKN